MNSKITRPAVAAAIVIAVLIGINLTGRSSVAWADVVRNIQNARTLVYETVFTPENGQRHVIKTMVREPNLIRMEASDGKTWIIDHGEGRTLALDPNGGQALSSTTPPQTLNVYDTFRNFRSLPDFSVRRIGRRAWDGAVAEGFELRKASDDAPIVVWADPQTSLPVRIEQIVQEPDGKLIQVVTTDIVFDTELDESLFSLEVPVGYTQQRVDGPAERVSRLELRMKTAVKMNEIMRTCLAYVQAHDGLWPDQLQDLTRYGLAAGGLANPRRPDLEVGYVYRKPGAAASPQQVVLCEAYDSWDEGINVGCVDGHVEFIKDESALMGRLD